MTPLARLVLVFATAVCLSSCAATQRYQQLGRLGQAYTTASGKLLTTATNVYVDAKSERLLDNATLSRSGAGEEFDKAYQQDEKIVAVMGRLQDHAKLLGTYFSLLDELASTKAPDEIKSQVDATVGALNGIGKSLRGSGLVSESLFSIPARAVAELLVRGRLREEFTRNRDNIALELKTQQVLLAELAKLLAQDIAITQQIRRSRLKDALTGNAVGSTDAWVARRRELLTSQKTVADLEAASKAAEKLQKAFDSFLTNKPNPALFQDALTDLQSQVVVAKAIQG